MQANSKIYVAGHRGLVGSAIVRKLKAKGYNNILGRTSQELDLRDQSSVKRFFEEEQPEYVYLAAAKVGGILANSTYPAQFLYDNLMIQSNIIEAARNYGVKKLLFLGSTCIYPKLAPQPLKEEYLLTDELEPTNEPYAIAKIAGIKMCNAYNKQYGTNFMSVMPTNLYGPNDNFDLQNSHVLPALMRKIHEAKTNGSETVTIWGSGTPFREFLHVDDLADACVYLMENHSAEEIGTFVNIGTGKEISIRELAEQLCSNIGFEGTLVYDSTKPDGTPRKITDVTKLEQLGWRYSIELEEGVRDTYQWYLEHVVNNDE
ncbi:MAG: GDP-L-fucose synthase [Paenibacillus macerans]|uniref:GDP-L-fucose synthase n=1 Tax=Paenibacillus TaxID=44249 RepID=UPI00056CCA17|nr:GDP-L-fucose synthase [Paenibacillus macerans]MBS5910790.1 GDP-L-fucose synthase [Paenibacillus macerans]MCY7560698.1 GDP-L-fucose synthase [Paenibacillus macerans]MDU5948186.1 GDP-L-fucose synthase [Paenibacillus macerans]MDU7475127.1 GDP-L-fucose synthase [Paenibacillus macerans]MEC0139340.1 GDP-L-fucose synthase [Paenibacillus macerans]